MVHITLHLCLLFLASNNNCKCSFSYHFNYLFPGSSSYRGSRSQSMASSGKARRGGCHQDRDGAGGLQRPGLHRRVCSELHRAWKGFQDSLPGSPQLCRSFSCSSEQVLNFLCWWQRLKTSQFGFSFNSQLRYHCYSS